jgi:hypothetical protein
VRIYVSYCNDESRDISEHLIDQLIHRYGASNVQSTLALPTDQQRDSAITHASLVLVVISPRWIQTNTSAPNNVTTREIATALRLNKVIVPVLVQGAAVPSSTQLPSTIAALGHRQGIILRPDPDMADDLDRLFAEVNTQLRWAPMNIGLIIGGVVAMILQAGVIVTALTNFDALVIFVIPILIWVPIFLIYGVSIAVVRRRWAWGIALILGIIALPTADVEPLIPAVLWIKVIAFTLLVYAFSVILTLFGLFGPRQELQRLNRKPAELAARRRAIENG